MADNKIIEELKERIPQIKEGIDKVEDITGGKIQDIAQEIVEKLQMQLMKIIKKMIKVQ